MKNVCALLVLVVVASCFTSAQAAPSQSRRYINLPKAGTGTV